MPIDRWMDKEDMVHIYNGILLSHKKEQNWVICRDVDGSRDCHTEWSKSERENQISYVNAYMWNLNGKRIWKRIDTCICITESFCCIPETNTTLLITYAPI